MTTIKSVSAATSSVSSSKTLSLPKKSNSELVAEHIERQGSAQLINNVRYICHPCRDDEEQSEALLNLARGMTPLTAINFARIQVKRDNKFAGMTEGALEKKDAAARLLFNKIVAQEKELGLLTHDEAEKKAIKAGGFKLIAPRFDYIDADEDNYFASSFADSSSTDPLDLLIAREEVQEIAGAEEFAEVLSSQSVSSLSKIKEYLTTEATLSGAARAMIDVVHQGADAVADVACVSKRMAQLMIKNAGKTVSGNLLATPHDKAEHLVQVFMKKRDSEKSLSKRHGVYEEVEHKVTYSTMMKEAASRTGNLFVEGV